MAIVELDFSLEIENNGNPTLLSSREASFIETVRMRADEISQYNPNLPGLLSSDPAQFSHVLKRLTDEAILNGQHFCEWGSGIGMIAGLAAINGFDAYGIEADSVLYWEAGKLVKAFALNVVFAQGSFVPAESTGRFVVNGTFGATDWAPTEHRDLYAELGQPLSEMNLVYAYPWPREVPFYQALFDLVACEGAVLWLYRHGSAPKLLQKVSNTVTE